MKPASQKQKILRRLISSTGQWVAMPALARAATKTGIGVPVHSRIADLRAIGFAIANRCEMKRGQKHSFYMLAK